MPITYSISLIEAALVGLVKSAAQSESFSLF
jgi:hypothetical protein